MTWLLGVTKSVARGDQVCGRCNIVLLSLEMCLEKRAFYRIISGMHASINIHLSAMYVIKGMLLW